MKVFFFPFAAVLLLGCNAQTGTTSTATQNSTPESAEEEAVVPDLVLSEDTEGEENMQQEFRVRFNWPQLDATSKNQLETDGHLVNINYDENWGEFNLNGVNSASERLLSLLGHSSIKSNYIYKDRPDWFRYAYWELLLSSLPSSVDYLKTYDGYVDAMPQNSGFATMIYTMDRSPEHVEFVWDFSKSFLFEKVSKARYEEEQWNWTVDALLETHAALKSGDNLNARLDSLSSALRNVPTDLYEHTQNEIALYGPYVPSNVTMRYGDNLENLDGQVMELVNSTSSIWFVSFWVRRHREGNVNAVATILEEIQQHYSY